MVKPIRLDEQLCFSIYKTQKQFNHFYSKALAKYNLTYPQYITLLSLYEHGTMSVKQVGESLDLDSGTLTPLLKRLEDNGWIKRSRSTTDERRVDVSLTEHAKGLRDEIFTQITSCLNLLHMSQNEYEQIKTEVTQVDQKLMAIPDDALN